MENKNREVIRNGDGDGDGDGEEEDETKMEKFYSLLRSFRDARDRRRRELQELEKTESNKKKMKTTTATTKPKAEASFEWQDFTTEIHFRKPPLIFPNPIQSDNNKGNKKKEQLQEHALDLKLAL